MAPFFTSVSQSLQEIARRYGLEAKLMEHRLRRAWPEIVGKQIAAHTRPHAIRFKKLYLVAESSVWLQQLMFLKPVLLEKINGAGEAPLVTDIVFRVGQVGDTCGQTHGGRDHPVQGGPGEETGHDPSTESLAEAALHAQGITNPDLRAQLTELMARFVTAQRSGKK